MFALLGFAHRLPGTVVVVRFDAGVDEGEAHAAIVNIGVGTAIAAPWLSGLISTDIFFKLAVQACVGVVEGFSVPAGDGWFVEQPLWDVAEESVIRTDLAAPVGAVGLVLKEDGDFFRVLLTPLECAFGSGDHNTQVVFMANADLRRTDQAFSSIGEFSVGGEVVVDRAARDKLVESGGNFFDVESGDKAKLHQGVGSDVSTAATASGFFRVGSPFGLHLAGVFKFVGQPALQVVGIDPTDVPEQAALHDMTAEPARPVAEVGMGDSERNLFFSGLGDQQVGFFEVDGERFLTHHRDAELESFHRGVEVDKVRSDDDDVIDAFVLGQFCLVFEKFIVGRVSFDWIGPVVCFVHRDFRVRVQSDGVHFAGSIEVDGFLMRVGNEGSGTSADHGNFKWLWGHRNVEF